MADQRPAVFIGSSSEGDLVAREVESQLKRYAEPNIWKDNFFKQGESTLEALTNRLDSFDFAVFVLSPDDKIETRGRSYSSPRDNVLFELGLFMGSLGRKRTFIVHAQGEDLKLPSDLAGITMSSYPSRESQNLAAEISRTCMPIIRAIQFLGFRESRKPSYTCQESERSTKEQGTFKTCASRSTNAKYLVLRGRDILSSDGEIALLSQNATPLLQIKLLMVDFETLSSEKFHEIRETMDLKWDPNLGEEKLLDVEKQMARDRLAFARDLSKRKSGFQYKLLPNSMVPEIKLRLYNHIGFFTFYRKNVGFSSEVQNRPIFCVEDQDPSRGDHSPLLTTLQRWFDELWELSRKPL